MSLKQDALRYISVEERGMSSTILRNAPRKPPNSVT